MRHAKKLCYSYGGLLLTTLLSASPTFAVEYNGRVRLGTYSIKETTKDTTNSGDTNNTYAYLGQIYFNARELGPLRNEFFIDYRDKYDFFGAPGQERLNLVSTHNPRLRQLAFAKPFHSSTFKWTLGRFSILEAGVIANDGIDLGYRISPHTRLGAFAGLKPIELHHRNFADTDSAKQAGLYAVYQEHGRSQFSNVYIANGIVAELYKKTPQEIVALNTEGTITPEATTKTTTDTNEPIEETVAGHLNTQIVYQPSQNFRLTSMSYLLFSPKIYLRNLFLSARTRPTPKTRFDISLTRLDYREYLRTRDLLDVMPPSAYSQAKGGLEYLTSRNVSFIIGALYGVRSVDNIKRHEISIGTRSTRIFSPHFAAEARIGTGSTFSSSLNFLDLELRYYAKFIELAVRERITQEKLYTQGSLNASISEVEAGMLFGRSIYASLMAQYATNERVTAMAGLFTVAYRFNSQVATPIRRIAPSL